MKNVKIGFIGCGKMAQAMICGMIKANIPPTNITASALSEKTRNLVASTYNINITSSNVEIARNADILFLAVNPNQYKLIVEEISNEMKTSSILISIAAGITIAQIEEMAPNRTLKVIRTMPNTPALVGEGMTAITINKHISDIDLEVSIDILKKFGKVELISEDLMDIIPAVSGSSPAYVYMVIEALADGAVLQGMPREKAYKLAAQSVYGAAKMVLETNQHPGTLKDAVCSPGGATIEAIATLEKNALRGTIIEAMNSCTNKVKNMN